MKKALRSALISLLVTATLVFAFIVIDDTHDQTVGGIKTHVFPVIGSVTFATLDANTTAADGEMQYCTDCQRNTEPCQGVGSGAMAIRRAGMWECLPGGGTCSLPTPTPLTFGTPGVIAVFNATELGSYAGAICPTPGMVSEISASGGVTCITPTPGAAGDTPTPQPTATPQTLPVPAGTPFATQYNNSGAFGGTGPGVAGQFLASNGPGSPPSFETVIGSIMGPAGWNNTLGAATNYFVQPTTYFAGTKCSDGSVCSDGSYACYADFPVPIRIQHLSCTLGHTITAGSVTFWIGETKTGCTAGPPQNSANNADSTVTCTISSGFQCDSGSAFEDYAVGDTIQIEASTDGSFATTPAGIFYCSWQAVQQ